ncbi:MAG: Eco57I restriction-modification methylase domain-containing protein [Pseudomonadota bacterium]
MNLQYFDDLDFYLSVKKFFEDLNIPIHYLTEQPSPAKEIISNTYKPNNPAHQLINQVYFLGMVDDGAFNNEPSIIDNNQLKKRDYDGLLIFGVTLDRQGGKLPTRGQLAEITRAFNREYHYTPVVIVFKYGRYISFSNCERIPYKQKWREGEKAGKVSLLKDIDTIQTHTGHLKILENLAITPTGKKAVTTFDGLYDYWQEVFNVSLLSKQFYRELSNWYFWALQHVEFPDDAEKDREVRNATSVIRLITRFMFVWFLKEKNLVPGTLFDKKELDEHLNYKDCNDSTYYKAILQNLFFATLNTKMKKDDPQSRKFVNRQYGIQEFYRYERFFRDKNKALKLFETIPFLNGGLFENLDKNIGRSDEIRTDCFSNRPTHEKRLKVPDFLFFGDEDQIDLSKVYGSKKRKNETVRGLIHILNSYKFTIAENTPIEEEIALDPELLGKVFENLLASYNPETQTTARKQTGSFYTPREIVNYMVDESLKASLSNLVSKKIDNATEDDIKTGLDILFEYTEKEHAFTDNEVSRIVEAISELKILDPACGSGAFPMGILHKLVFILNKIDGDNKKWRELQKQRAVKETESAYNLGNKEVRHQRLKEIEEAFDFNTSDYGRKLFLIENSIYGVDIQAIAVQIAKLRFFISLIVDQNIDEDKENMGILPLPNLETKFVAANTLIGIDKKGQMELNFQNPEIDKKEKELAKVRERHFSARTPNTKQKHREKDGNLRNEIADLLKKEGYASGVTKKLAHWNPYDQNTYADFFDMEWMFGVEDGFDVVIGNPPYVRADSGEQHLTLRKAIEESAQYETLWEKWDLYIPFIERGYKLLKPGGVTTMIVSDAFCHSKYAQKSQDWFLKNSRVLRLDFFSKIKIFDAGVHNITYLFQKADGNHHKPERRVHDPEFGAVKILPSAEQRKLTYRAFFPEDTAITFSAETVILNDICYITKGMVVHANERIAQGAFEMNDLISETRDKTHSKPFVEGKHLDRWLPATNKWLEWGTDRAPAMFSRPTFPQIYEVDDKILVQRSPGPDPKACYDNQRLHFTESSVGFIPWHSFSGVRNRSLKKSARYYDEKPPRPDLPKREELEKISRRFAVKFLLAVMNSTTARNFLRTNRRSNIHLYPNDWKQLPIPDVSSKKQAPVVKLVDEILTAMRADRTANIATFEAEIDARVAHLYNLTEEEYALILKEINCADPFRVAALNVYRDIAREK